METKNPQIIVMFPIAGRGARFGYKFKPFLKIGSKTFIERAVESFSKNLKDIKETVFVFLKEQEEEFNVTNQLKKMFPSLKFRAVILDTPTNSHAETVRKGIAQGKISEKIILCDCDHYLNTKPIFEHLKNSNDDSCVIPLWEINENEVQSWAIASVDSKMNVLSIAEKKFPEKKGNYFGVIGCYYFNDSKDLLNESMTSISDSIKALIEKNEIVKGVQINDAEFFGDPQRLQNVLNTRKL